MTSARFGPAGNPDAFYEAGYKASVEMPEWLSRQGLKLYEYQCSRGANISESTARSIGEKAAEYGVFLSIHAPYYISLATEDEATAANTRKHFLKSLTVAKWMGAKRVVFHMGGSGKMERRTALEKAKALFGSILTEVESLGLHEGVYLTPETMGKQNQLGTLDEVLELCQMAHWVRPAIDFGHLHAVSGGQYTTKEEYAAAFDSVVNILGEPAAAQVHIHFSRIEFTKAGERRHWTFEDPYGPPFEPLLQVVAERGYSPWIVCESAGTQAKDACSMQEFYFSLLDQRRML